MGCQRVSTLAPFRQRPSGPNQAHLPQFPPVNACQFVCQPVRLVSLWRHYLCLYDAMDFAGKGHSPSLCHYECHYGLRVWNRAHALGVKKLQKCSRTQTHVRTRVRARDAVFYRPKTRKGSTKAHDFATVRPPVQPVRTATRTVTARSRGDGSDASRRYAWDRPQESRPDHSGRSRFRPGT